MPEFLEKYTVKGDQTLEISYYILQKLKIRVLNHAALTKGDKSEYWMRHYFRLCDFQAKLQEQGRA